MSETTRLRLAEDGRLKRLIGVHDALSSLLGAEAGFDGFWVSSFGVSASYLGLPDTALLTLNEMMEVSRRIRLVSDLPIVVDADTGYGDTLSVRRLMTEAAHLGIDAICIEDAAFPKRNSFLDRSHRALASVDVMCERVRMARMTQAAGGPQIIARTEVLTQGGSVATALERSEAYRQAGADAIIVHCVDKRATDLLEVASRWNLDCPLVAIPTAYPDIPFEVLQRAGIDAVVLANQLLRAAYKAMRDVSLVLGRAAAISEVEQSLARMTDIHDTVGLNEYLESEKQAVGLSRRTPLPKTFDFARAVADAAPLIDAVREDGIAIVRDVPAAPDVLVTFSQHFGTPMRRGGSTVLPASPFIADVRLRLDLAPEKRLPTETEGALALHTARSFETARPRHMMILMVDPGWPNGSAETAGESRFVRWRDVVTAFKGRFPETAEHDLALLTTVPISYRPWYVLSEVAFEPLLTLLPGGDCVARYWEGFVAQLDAYVLPEEYAAEFRAAVTRFDSVVHSCHETIRFSLRANELVVFDNYRVAHGRSSFIPTRRANEQIECNPRSLWTLHIAAPRPEER